MKSKKSFFSISKDILLEDMKKLWALPVFTYICSFLYVDFPFFAKDKNVWIYLNGDLSTSNIGYPFIQTLFPVLLLFTALTSAIVCFSYLHGKEKTATVHALPYSRKTLFQSHLLAGWLLVIAPIVLMTLTLLLSGAIKLAQGFTFLCGMDLCVTPYSHMLAWGLHAGISVTFVYSLGVLAGVIAGSAVVQLLLSLFLGGIAPITVAFTGFCLDYFITGYASDYHSSFNFHPLLQYYEYQWLPDDLESPLRIFLAVIYIAVSLLACFLASQLYRKIPLEDAGKSVYFRVIGETVCILIAFLAIPLSWFAMISYTGFKSSTALLLGGFLGSLVCYIISRMILEKKLKIWSRRALKSYCIFLIIAIAFNLFTVFDLTGIEKKVPAVSQIDSIVTGPAGNGYDDVETVYTDPKTIDLFTQLHTQLTKESEDKYGTYRQTIRLRYHLKNGKTLYRVYTCKMMTDDKLYQIYEQLYQSSEFQKWREENYMTEHGDLTFDYLNGMELQSKEEDRAITKDLITAIQKDAAAMTFQDFLESEQTKYDAEKSYTITFQCGESIRQLGGWMTRTWSYWLSAKNTHTLQVLKEYKLITDKDIDMFIHQK